MDDVCGSEPSEGLVPSDESTSFNDTVGRGGRDCQGEPDFFTSFSIVVDSNSGLLLMLASACCFFRCRCETLGVLGEAVGVAALFFVLALLCCNEMLADRADVRLDDAWAKMSFMPSFADGRGEVWAHDRPGLFSEA